MTEYLESIRVINNCNNITSFAIVTNYGRYKWELEYKIIPKQKPNVIHYDMYRYNKSLIDICRDKGIEYKDYFNMIHKDCK
jgi:hypothetical protein